MEEESWTRKSGRSYFCPTTRTARTRYQRIGEEVQGLDVAGKKQARRKRPLQTLARLDQRSTTKYVDIHTYTYTYTYTYTHIHT